MQVRKEWLRGVLYRSLPSLLREEHDQGSSLRKSEHETLGSRQRHEKDARSRAPLCQFTSEMRSSRRCRVRGINLISNQAPRTQARGSLLADDVDTGRWERPSYSHCRIASIIKVEYCLALPGSCSIRVLHVPGLPPFFFLMVRRRRHCD